MPRYTVFMYHPEDQRTPDEAQLAAELAEHDAYAQEMVAEGVMTFGSPLAEHTATTSIRAGGLVDGPYLEAKETVVGFYVLDVPDLDAAIAVARRNPILHQGGGVEVRPMTA